MKDELATNIYSILAMVVLADDRIYPEEVVAFSEGLQGLLPKIDPDIKISNDVAREWFSNKKDEISQQLRRPEFEESLRVLLWSFEDFPKRQDVFDHMVLIAHSDGEYHRSEHALIQTAADFWGIEYKIPMR